MIDFNEVEFANPEYFYLFIIIPIMILWQIFMNNKRFASMNISTLKGISKGSSLKLKLRYLPFILRLITVSAIILVLARPQTSSSEKSITSEGIDIVIALDVSTSMLAEDFKPNRMEAAKQTAIDFIDDRQNDRIGLVVFAGESFTQCPVTIDHSVVKNLLSDVKTGMIKDGTAIGMGLATAISRLKESKAKSKVIILLTDGVNNTGSVSPETAADIATNYGIRVYTIGVGTIGTAPYPVKDRFGRTIYQNIEVKIDEELLKKISDITDGEYFRARNNKSLEEIYEKINELEKTKIDVAYFSNYDEVFYPFAFIAIAGFLLELFLKYSFFRKFP